MRNYDIQKVNELANGLWVDILTTLTGTHESVFSRRGKPCPSCGGVDRFSFDDKEGRGTWLCRQCGGRSGTGGAGDGISLLMRINGWSFADATNAVGEWLHAPESDFSQIKRHEMPRRIKDIDPIVDIEIIDPQPESEVDYLFSEKVKIFNPRKGKLSTFKPTHVAIVRDQYKVLRGAVVRIEIDGKKIPMQVMYGVSKKTGEATWCIHGLGQDRPLYGADAIGDAERVVLVQGERKRDIASRVIKSFPVVSIVGGDSAIASMDLTPLHGKTVLIWPDNDWEGSSKNSGMRCAKRIGEMLAGKATVRIVNPPGESKSSGWDLGDAFENEGWDFTDFRNYVSENTFSYSQYQPEEIEYEPEEYQEPEFEHAIIDNSAPIDWPEPIDILGDTRPPHAPLELLPEPIGDFVFDQADLIGCDQGSLVVGCLVTCASAIDDSIKLQPKRHVKTWRESARLWGTFVGMPAEKKTPAMNEAMRPINEIEKILAEIRKAELKKYNEALEAYAHSKGRRKSKDEWGEELAKPEEPKREQYIVQSTTVEALQQIMANNTRGMLVFHDELAGWFGSMDAYGKNGSSKDRPIWLELYNGGPKTFNTVSRGEVYAPNWSASILGSIQPGAIRKIAASLPDDGLLQRFFVVCVTEGSSVGNDRPPTANVLERYNAMVKWLTTLRQDYPGQVIELSDEAMIVKNEFFQWARNLCSNEVITGGLNGHVGKYEGLYSRMLVVFHCCSQFGKKEFSWVVDKVVAEECAQFIRGYLFKHAMYFYKSILGGSMDEQGAAIIARKILATDMESFNNRDLARSSRDWRRMDDVEKLRITRLLDTYGWITPADYPIGAKLPTAWRVNPKVRETFKAHVEREKRRIENAKEAAADLL